MLVPDLGKSDKQVPRPVPIRLTIEGFSLFAVLHSSTAPYAPSCAPEL